MNIAFYITNHGFGHASRNVPIIKKLINSYKVEKIYVKSDASRCDFIKRNLPEYGWNIEYHMDCHEVGLILKEGCMDLDKHATVNAVQKDLVHWKKYINREKIFLEKNRVDIVISDIIPWAIAAAKEKEIPSILIGNFSWAQSYQSMGMKENLWKPYEEYYKMADCALWYELHDLNLEKYCKKTKLVSMVSRERSQSEIALIKSKYQRPIVFISMGASAEINEVIDVSDLPYEFLYTRGIAFAGQNAHALPEDMINTTDYIGAADYIITKGGWSTVAEIMLQNKPAAMLFRGNLTEDNITKSMLISRGHCIEISAIDLYDIQLIINRIDKLKQASYRIYTNDVDKICNEIIGVVR